MSDHPTDVHVHVHLVMGGAFPLRIADLLFTDEAVVVPEYRYLTPLFGLARGGVQSAGDAAVERFRTDGVAGLVDMANRTHQIDYRDLERVRLYGGRALGRPKVAVDVVTGPPHAYRIHAPVEMDRLVSALTGLGERRGFEVEFRSGLGFRPLQCLRRFAADR